MSYEKHFSVLKEITGDLTKELREDALAIDQLVVFGTPVDEGRARANWTVSVGQPNNQQIEAFGAHYAINQGQAELRKVNGFQTIYIQNNLPYIVRLNEGYSKQAASKYIDRIVEKVANAR